MPAAMTRQPKTRRTFFTLSVSLELADAVDAAAERKGLNRSEYIRERLERAVRRDLRKLDGERLSSAA